LPNIKSALKRVHVTSVKNLRNRMVKSQMRTAMRNFETAIAAGNADEAKALYPAAASQVDRAASKGVIHKNAASRQKARMAVRLNKVAK